jgi:hypothetical protein
MKKEKKITSKKSQREDQKAHSQLVHMKPFPHHSPKELAFNLNQLVHALYMFIQYPILQDSPIKEIGDKLKFCIQLVDKIVVPVKD